MLATTGSAEDSLTEKDFPRVFALIDCHTLTRLDVLHLFRLGKRRVALLVTSDTSLDGHTA